MKKNKIKPAAGAKWKLLVSILIPLSVLLMPTSLMPFANITVVEHRMLAILLMAVFFWILEPIPVFATSVMIILAELLLLSNKAPIWVRDTVNMPNLGELITYQSILGVFASPIIMLFLGGFFLAAAATKYRLDINLARILLKPFGDQPRWVMLGVMAITAVFSMFMSNTATTAMMLAILAPVVGLFDRKDPGRIAILLAVPFAANIGGLGTPIGTPPNAIAMKYLEGDMAISFGEWMSFALPLVVVLLFLAWFVLLLFFKPKQLRVKLVINTSFDRSWRAWVVYATFAGTILLWLTGKWHGMSSYVVAVIPVTVFVVTQIMTKQDLQKLSWDVLWLIAGGIALGLGLERTGLSASMLASVPFDAMSPYFIVFIGAMIALTMATLMSNTATANLLFPIMAALGASLSSLDSLGGTQMLLLLVALSCSMGMALPISTPPNALAYAAGGIEQKDMLKAGGLISLIGIVGIFALMAILNVVGYF